MSQWGSIGISDANKLYVHKDPATYRANKTIANLIDDINSKLQSKRYEIMKNDEIDKKNRINI